MTFHTDTKHITAKEHADMVLRLAKPGGTIIEELSSRNAHLLHMAVGVCGEAGELIDIIKKLAIYGKLLTRDIEDHIIEELGDIEFYLQGIRAALGVTREEILRANINKLGERYPDQTYTNKAAQERADKPAGE